MYFFNQMKKKIQNLLFFLKKNCQSNQILIVRYIQDFEYYFVK